MLCLRNLSQDFIANNMKKKSGVNGYEYDFSVDFSIIDNSNIMNIHKCLMKKHDIK